MASPEIMATLFGSRSKGKLSSDVMYTELPQHMSDDDDDIGDEEDDLLFVRSASNVLQNGSSSSRRNGRYGQGEVIELGNLGGGVVKAARLHPGVEVRQGVFARKCFFITTILAVAIFVVVLALGLPRWTQQSPTTTMTTTPVINNATWTTLFDHYGTESCIQLVDVDGDGLLDVLLGMGSAKDLSTATDHDPEEFCKQSGRKFPCLGVVVALKGTNGKELWRTFTDSAVFLMNCEEFDVDRDGKTDCIMTGRQGTVVAINPRTGKHLWKVDRKFLKRQWNTYQVSALPDLDGDGVEEILLAHGGEPKFPPEQHKRNAGRLILLSGKTGQSIGKYLDLPDNKETYMSPVIYTFDDGSQYILFGSGGETIPGDFMAISVKDFYHYVSDSDKVYLNGSSQQWDHMTKDEIGIIKIFSGTQTGIMVPPVVIDVNLDGVKDILMTAFEGKMILYDGKTLKPLWTLTLPGCQAYSTPAPGYFDVDNKPDFIASWNNGTWPTYQYAMMIVVSGADGAILWKTVSQQYNMASPLSLRTHHHNQDTFLFELVGRQMSHLTDINGAIHGIIPQRNLSKRHDGKEEMQDYSNKLHELQLKHTRKSGKKTLPAVPERQGGNGSTQTDSTQGQHTQPDPTQDQHTQADSTQGEHTPAESTHDEQTPADEDKEGGPHQDHITCAMNLTSLRSEVFLMDRTSMGTPILIWSKEAETLNYTLTDGDRALYLQSINDHKELGSQPLTQLPPDAMKNTKGHFCTVLKASVLNTGAIGDTDGDGRLDYIVINSMLGLITDKEGTYIRMTGRSYVSKVNLVSAVDKFKTISLKTSGTS